MGFCGAHGRLNRVMWSSSDVLRPVEGIPSGLLKPEEHGCYKAEKQGGCFCCTQASCKMNAMLIAERFVSAKVNPKWKELS